MIIWAGTSSEDVGMVIQHYPKVIIPARKREVQAVPGRSGDIIIEFDTFENYEQQYDCFLDAKQLGGLETVIPKVSDWLLGNRGYNRLEDTYFPDVYRMAYVVNSLEFTSHFNEYGWGTLTFNCAPEKYFKMGEEEITLSKNQKLFNPSSFPAKPLITLTLNGSAGTFTLNGNNISISSGLNGNLILDIKQHTAFNESTNKSSMIQGEYEKLYLGKESTFTWSGGITAVKIVPRWWTI